MSKMTLYWTRPGPTSRQRRDVNKKSAREALPAGLSPRAECRGANGSIR